jgi:HK97 family phage portal protein
MGVINDLSSFVKDYKAFSLYKKSLHSMNTTNISEWKPFKFAFDKETPLDDTYESNVDAYSVIRKIVEVFKSVNWIVEQRQSDGSFIQVENTTIHDLMANPNMGKSYTWQDIDEQLVVYLLCNGNSYLYGEELSGKIQEVDVLPSTYVTPQTNDDFFMPNVRYKFKFDKNKRTFDNEELEHTMLFNPSYCTTEESFNGLSVFEVARRVIEVGNDRWDADAHLLKNRGVAGMITNKSNRPMTNEEAAKIQSGFDANNTGTDKFGKVRVTNQDLSFIQMAMSSTDLQLVEKGVITLRAMCNVLGLDSSLFNDPANKTFNNRKEAEKAMYTNAIIPLAEKIAEKHTKFIAKNHYPEGNYRMRKDFSKVPALQDDMKAEAEKDKIVMDGVNVVLNMPVSTETKQLLLKENYNLSDDIIDSLVPTEVEGLNIDTDLGEVGGEIALNVVNENAQAQANLLGSVGGVQGILAIQQGVASGVTSESAAVSTMVEIYGFDEQTARNVLGL